MVQDLPEISQTVLNLAEFMEHCEKGPLPIETTLLGEQAVKCRAYAKALHYKEVEFFKKPTVPVIESLISINNKLGQKEAATGLLEWGRKNLPDLKVQERYYEKLHDWEKALKIYAEKAAEAPDDPDVALGRMRCLEKLGEWGDLHAVAEAQWQVYSTCFGGRLRSLCAHYHHVAGGGRRDQEQDGADGGLGLVGQAGVERDGALRAAAAAGEPGRRLLPRRALRAPPAVDGGAGADRPDEGPPRH